MSNDKAQATYGPVPPPVPAGSVWPRTPNTATPWYTPRPKLWVAYLLLILTGLVGGHRYYQHKYVSAVIYTFTGGLFGLGVIWDACTLWYQIATWKPRLYAKVDPNTTGVDGIGSIL